MNIIITGASRGIGYQLALEYCRTKDNHVIAISRNELLLRQLQNEKEYNNLPGRLIIQPFDLTSLAKKTEKLIQSVTSEFKHIDILINNAGKLVNYPFAEFNMNEAHEVFEVNFFSPALLIQKLLPFMGKKSFSHIINISSMGGFQGSAKFPGLSYYSAGKAAIACLTECLAEELKDSNIYVNCLALGAVQTEMLKEAFPGYKAPLSAKEMAKWIADFSVNGYRYFNGKILPVSVSTP